MKDRLGISVFKIVTIAFVIGIITCGIVDLAVNGVISWSGYPFVSIVYAWLLIIPMLVTKKHKIDSMLVMTTVTTLPFLFLLDAIVPGRSWFLALGVPIGGVSLAALWITYFIFKFLKISYWHKAALTLFLFGIIVSGAAQLSVGIFTGDVGGLLFSVNAAINTSVILGLVIILLVKGLGKGTARREAAEAVSAFQN